MTDDAVDAATEALPVVLGEISRAQRAVELFSPLSRSPLSRARNRRHEVRNHIAKRAERTEEIDLLLKVDRSLTVLECGFERVGRAFELRYFGGYEVKTIAASLSRSEDTVRRDIRLARAFILREISKQISEE